MYMTRFPGAGALGQVCCPKLGHPSPDLPNWVSFLTFETGHSMGHGTRDTGHETRETGHGKQDTGHGTRDTRHRTWDIHGYIYIYIHTYIYIYRDTVGVQYSSH